MNSKEMNKFYPTTERKAGDGISIASWVYFVHCEFNKLTSTQQQQRQPRTFIFRGAEASQDDNFYSLFISFVLFLLVWCCRTIPTLIKMAIGVTKIQRSYLANVNKQQDEATTTTTVRWGVCENIEIPFNEKLLSRKDTVRISRLHRNCSPANMRLSFQVKQKIFHFHSAKKKDDYDTCLSMLELDLHFSCCSVLRLQLVACIELDFMIIEIGPSRRRNPFRAEAE